jgi:hypothetical protein
MREVTMRCLRCALDFGPDERYCDRCGRALSRPLGEAGPGEDSSPANQEASLYSTALPPDLTAAPPRVDARDTAISGTPALPPASGETPLQRDGAAPAVTVQSDRDERQEAEVEMNLEERTQSETSGPSAPSHPTDEDHHEFVLPEPAITSLPPEELFGDEEEGGTGIRERPAVIGADLSEHRRAHARPVASRRLLAVVAVLIVLAIAVLVQRRYALYTDQLASAQSLEAHHQVAAALTAYKAAESDWPWNGAAQSGARRMQSLVDAQNARLAAQRAAALVVADRAAVMADWQALQQQAAARLDRASAAGR